MFERLKQWARALTRDVHAVYLAARDPRVPWYVKAIAVFVAAYALSPIDLIPDAIPVLGYVDDLIVVPLGIWIVIKLIPPAIMAEHRRAADQAVGKPVSRAGTLAVICFWLVFWALLVWLVILWLPSGAE